MPTLHLLGTGSGLLNPERHASAYLLQTDAGDLLFDCGEPVAATLARGSYDWSRLDAIVISHTHADHLGGLPMLIQQVYLSRRTSPLALYGPPEYVARCFDHLGMHYLLAEQFSFPFEAYPLLAQESFQTAGAGITPWATRHLEHHGEALAAHGHPNRGQAYAFRVSVDDIDWLYSGDLGSFADIREALDGCRYALVDSTHIELDEVLEWARAHPETEVLLTHVSAQFDPARLQERLRREGPAAVRPARDGEALIF